MIKNITIAILVIIQFISAQQLPSIAVLDLDAKGVAKDEASVLTDKLRGELFQTDRFQVIERSVMHEVLKEQGFQQAGCTSNECAVEAGQLIGVQYMVAGSIGRIEKTYLISIRLIDVATGKIEKNVQKEQTGTLTDVLKDGIPYVVKELVKPFSGSDAKVSESPVESKKPVSKDGKKGFFSKGKMVVSLSYSRSIGTSTFEDNVAVPSEYDKIKFKTNGFNVGAGYRFGYHYLGMAFTYHGTVSLKLDNNIHTLERYLWGINAEYYFERLKFRDIFIIAPGIALGYWNLKDHGIYDESETDKVSDFSFNVFGGPQAKIELGLQRIHLFVTYTFLIVGDTREISTVQWIKPGDAPHPEGTYYIDSFINLINLGVSFQFK